MGTLDALRALSEEDVTVQAFRRALASDDPAISLRAAEALLSRVHGKPKETVRQETAPEDLQAIRDMTQEERDRLYAELLAAEGLDLSVTPA